MFNRTNRNIQRILRFRSGELFKQRETHSKIEYWYLMSKHIIQKILILFGHFQFHTFHLFSILIILIVIEFNALEFYV